MLQQTLIERNQPEGAKSRLFRLFHTLVLHFSVHTKFYNILLFLQILQLVRYACHDSFRELWPSSPMPYIQTVLGFTDLSALWKTARIALMVFTASNLLLNAVISGLILYQIRKSPQKLEEPNLLTIKILGYYYVILRTILLLPSVLAYLCFLSPALYGLSSNEAIVLGCISCGGMIFLILNATLGLLFLRDNSPFSKKEFSASVSWIQQFRVGIKVVLGLYGSFASGQGETFSYLFAGAYLLVLLEIGYMMLTRPGLFNYPFNRIYQFAFFLPLWTLISALSQQLFSPEESTGFILWIIGLLILPFGWGFLQSHIEVSLLTTNYHSLTSSNHYLIYNFACIRLALERSIPDRIILLEGVLTLHSQNCNKPPEVCICSRVKQSLLGRPMEPTREEFQTEGKLWFQFIRQNLEEISEKYQKTTQIWFLLAYIENEVLNNKFRSLHSLEEGQKHQGGIRFQFLNYHYLRKVEARMVLEDKIENGKKAVDINRFFKFQVGFTKLQEMIEESAYKHSDYWELLKSDKVSRQKLYWEGTKITTHLQEVKQQYEDLITLNTSNIHCMILYGNFMKVIVNSTQAYERSQQHINAAKRSMTQVLKIQSDVQKEKYGQNSVTAVVVISGDRKNIGVIKHCTAKINQITGYVPHQLLGQNINLLMPKFIGNMHDDVLRNYLQLSQSQHDNVERIVPMIDVNNFLVLGRVLSKPFPNLLNGLQLIGIFNQIIETSLNHPGEKPKYVLYRSDTGLVQALSQSCSQEFHYRINKIDEFHETSSELTFESLFVGLKESEVIDGRRAKCSALSRCSNTSDFQAISVEVFQRLHIYYYSVNLRMLCFYTLGNYKQIESVREMALDTIDQSLLIKEGQMNKQNNQDNNKTLKEKFLHEEGKKDNMLGSKPMAFRILRVWGSLFLLITLALAVYLVVLHNGSTKTNDYVTIASRQMEVIGHVCEVAFHGRLKHMTVFYASDLPPLSYINDNLAKSIEYLQKSEIALDETYLKYGNYDNLVTKEYTYGTSKIVMSQIIKLNNHIFDYITVTSALSSIPVPALNFTLQILQVPAPVTGTTIMFKTRYNALFQILPWETVFKDNYSALFQEILDQIDSSDELQLILSLLGLGVGLLVSMFLALSVVSTTDGTLLLFGYMRKEEIEKEVVNCQNFLEIFYQDSYIIKLKQRQLIKETNMFEDPTLRNSMKSGLSSPGLLGSSRMELHDPPSRNTVNFSINRIEYLEKELHLRTDGELMLSQSEQDNERMGLRAQPSSSQDDGLIYDRLVSSTDECRRRVVVLYLLLFLMIGSYFVTEHLLYTSFTGMIRQNIGHLRLAYNNINSLKMIKLYALETYINNSTFLNYPAPGTTLDVIYSQLYQNQRDIDQLNVVGHLDTIMSQYNYNNLCSKEVIDTLKSSPNLLLTSPSDFSLEECSSLLGGALEEGIRMGIVGYAQAYHNISRLNISSMNVSVTNLNELINIQKYLQIPLWDFVSEHVNEISMTIDQKKHSLWLCLGIFIGLASTLYLAIWVCSMFQLLERLQNTRRILGFIPIRVFVRNAKLTKQYESYIGELMH